MCLAIYKPITLKQLVTELNNKSVLLSRDIKPFDMDKEYRKVYPKWNTLDILNALSLDGVINIVENNSREVSFNLMEEDYWFTIYSVKFNIIKPTNIIHYISISDNGLYETRTIFEIDDNTKDMINADNITISNIDIKLHNLVYLIQTDINSFKVVDICNNDTIPCKYNITRDSHNNYTLTLDPSGTAIDKCIRCGSKLEIVDGYRLKCNNPFCKNNKRSI